MEETLYDVAVIGGGPGGSSFATYARQKGLSVILFEKEKFPRDHVGESLIPYTYYKMQELGVLDEVRKFATYKPGVNFVDIDGSRESTWCFGKVLKDDSHLTFHTVRSIFDDCLLKNSVKHGAEVYEEHTAKEVILDDPSGNVILRVQNKEGISKTVKAKFFIDASGQGSFLASKFKTKTGYRDLDRVAFFNHWLDTTYDQSLIQGLIKIVYLGGMKKGWIWVIPVGRNHLSIGVTLSNDYVKEQKAKILAEGITDWSKELYQRELSYAVALQPIIKGARMEHKTVVQGDYSFYSDKKFGKNWAMVGDSGAFLDPIFSSGIYVAMETACKVADCVNTTLKVGQEEGQKQFEKEFQIINDGYALIEKFVRLFYDPNTLNFAHVDPQSKISYDKFLYAYNIFHYLLAGDFFLNSKKYSDFLDTIYDERTYKRFMDFIQTKWDETNLRQNCLYEFHQMYGHLEGDQVVEVLVNFREDTKK